MERELTFSDPKFYKNRELSWLQFEERILDEAVNPENPLFEQLKFLSITDSNLDEFFMIRVASLKDMVHAGCEDRDISGMTPMEQIEAVSLAAHSLEDAQYDVLNRELLPKLMENGIRLSLYDELTEKEKEYINSYYKEKIYPVLTPIAIDADRPFPLIRNKYLYVGGFIKKRGSNEDAFAMVQLPKSLDRVIRIPSDGGSTACTCILLEEVIKHKFSKLFSGSEVSEIGTFKVLRNADLSIDAEDADDLLSKIEEQVEKREWGEAIRLQVSGLNAEALKDRLSREMDLYDDEIYFVDGPLDLTFLMSIYDFEGYDKLKKAPYIPVMPWEFDEKKSLFSQIKEHDLMLVHPFESFKPVIDFIKEASEDKDVIAIKQTLYRVSGNSPIVKALAHAAENGKQVTVLVELKARFDEENNIVWARMLERAGCQVIYGFAKLKTHCKITQVIRKEGDSIVRYVHLGTGNYNDTTAKLYTDVGFFTAKEEFGEDATSVFNLLSGYSEPDGFNKLSLAPKHLREKFLSLIHRETENARGGKSGHIIAKMNSLCDKEIINALYEASCAGVEVELIVRGICCLRAGVPGLSENITVRSIVGNFLEHSRIYYFKNGGAREYYCSSADWMPRNLDRRIEILFPVERVRLKEKLRHLLMLMLRDNRKAWFLQPDGTYKKMPDAEYLYSFQEGFCEEETEEQKG